MWLWKEEEEKNRREDRELQFEMFRVTLAHDFLDSFLTAMIAVSVFAMLTLSYMPGIPSETKVSVVTSALNMFFIWIVAIVVLLVTSLW